MFTSTVILSLLLATISSATPIERNSNNVNLEFVTKIAALDGKTLAEIDRERASEYLKHSFGSNAAGKVISTGVTNTGVTYTAKVGVGSPPTQCEYANDMNSATIDNLLDDLLIDTGSSNTFVGTGGKAYVQTSSSINTGGTVVCILTGSRFISPKFHVVCDLREWIILWNRVSRHREAWTRTHHKETKHWCSHHLDRL
jgi:cathepsin E